jgi:hypothetical protein
MTQVRISKEDLFAHFLWDLFFPFYHSDHIKPRASQEIEVKFYKDDTQESEHEEINQPPISNSWTHRKKRRVHGHIKNYKGARHGGSSL